MTEQATTERAAQGWQDITTAPKDQPILAWCDHDADPYVEDEATGRLTLYGAHAESVPHAGIGYRVLEWGGGWDDSTYEYEGSSLPDWWFVVGSEFEVVANPTHWTPLPSPPLPSPPLPAERW